MITPISYLVELKVSGSWTSVAADDVLTDLSGLLETTGQRDQAIAFGDDSEILVSINFRASVWSSLADMTPVRVTFTTGSDTAGAFVGVVTERHRTINGDCDIQAKGVKVLIQATKAYSVAYQRRPLATKTTATSVEDPTTGGYPAGIVNFNFWQAGGRPYEQAGSYPSAPFYYSCDQALLSSDWSWSAGEDGWGECLKAAQASGGQIYQGGDGVVRYKQVLGYGSGTALYTFDESVYTGLEETISSGDQLMTKVVCQYVPRAVRGTQQIADDATPRFVGAGESVTIVLEPETPIARLETQAGSLQLLDTAVVVTSLDAGVVSQGSSGYTHTLDVKAARVTLIITNASGAPFVVWRVVLRGDPITAGVSGSISAGTGTLERPITDNAYIQSRSHAGRLARMTLAFYGASRAVRKLSGCAYDAARVLGETVNLSSADWSISAQAHVITAIKHDDTGASAEYDLVYVGDLPKSADFYIVGTAYSSGTTKYLGW